jgi:hypothetical protein
MVWMDEGRHIFPHNWRGEKDLTLTRIDRCTTQPWIEAEFPGEVRWFDCKEYVGGGGLGADEVDEREAEGASLPAIRTVAVYAHPKPKSQLHCKIQCARGWRCNCSTRLDFRQLPAC